jgi:hypothetical protein
MSEEEEVALDLALAYVEYVKENYPEVHVQADGTPSVRVSLLRVKCGMRIPIRTVDLP